MTENGIACGDAPTASDIIELLRAKHASDIFVDACKTDATYGGPDDNGHHFFQMDGWAVKKSWVLWGMNQDGSPYKKGATIGYEIKVSRSDFLRDKKWQFYLENCHRFFFVCPNGLIDPRELPREAGLLWVTKTGTSLRCVKDAPARAIHYPVGPLLYALICRSIASPLNRRWKERRRSLQEWKEFALARQSIGHAVRRAMFNDKLADQIIDDFERRKSSPPQSRREGEE